MKRIFFILLSAVLCAGLVYSAYTLGIAMLGSSEAVSVFAQGSGIDLSLKIVDESGLPVQGARLDIAETGQQVSSDEQGEIMLTDLKEVKDSRFDSLLPKTWSEYTLILSKDDYISYVLLNYALSAEQSRPTMEIVMYERGITNSENAICLVDSPPREWVDALVRLY